MEHEEAAARPSKKARGTAASGLTAFGLRLAKHLADAAEGADGVNSGGQNVVFSPVSIYAALALMSAGARGTTLDEVLTVLGAASRDESSSVAWSSAHLRTVPSPVRRLWRSRARSGTRRRWL